MSGSSHTASPRRALGVDVGGTKIAIGLVGADGTLGRTARVENREASGPRDLLARAVEECRRLLERPEGATVEAIGVGLPELVDLGGQVRSSTAIPWTREEILGAFGGGPPVVLEAEHLCMTMRGIKKPGSVTVTSAVRGLFRSDARTRQEAMNHIGKRV